MTRLWWWMLAVLPLFASAQERAVVEIEIIPETVVVGEPATMRVTVLGPTWFAKPPVWPSFEVPNAVVRLPPNSSMPTSRRVNGAQWSGIVRDYEVYPLMPAQYLLGGQSIRVIIANPGTDAIVADMAVPEVLLGATVPAGAEGLNPYLAGTKLSLSREIDGDPDSFEAGDAVVITTVAEIEGLRAMFLPPMTETMEIDGVSVYPEEPVIEDGATARRTEKVTLVFTSGGEFTVPGIALDWWDKSSGSITTETLPEPIFSVAGPTATVKQETPDEKRDWKIVAAVILVLAALLYALWWVTGRLALRARQRAAAIRRSESYAFRQLIKACAKGNARHAYHALAAWMDRLESRMEARRFAQLYGDDALSRELDALSVRAYADPEREVDWRALSRGLEKARAAFNAKNDSAAAAKVPPLNP